jgi:hypothetical protein
LRVGGGATIHEDYYRLFSAKNTIIVNGASQGSGGWENIAINTVQNVAMEPQPFADAVSSNFSFTCSSFADNMGSNAEATQQRTLSIVRTSPTNGFYVDFFRSKSTVSSRVATTLNGNVTNQFHDYIYHNIGSTNISLTTNGVTLPLLAQPNRFQNDIGDAYGQPGWRDFTNTVVSYPHSQQTRVLFNATPSGTTLYMDMLVAAVTNREYARVSSPPIVGSRPGEIAFVSRQLGGCCGQHQFTGGGAIHPRAGAGRFGQRPGKYYFRGRPGVYPDKPAEQRRGGVYGSGRARRALQPVGRHQSGERRLEGADQRHGHKQFVCSPGHHGRQPSGALLPAQHTVTLSFSSEDYTAM